jgi:tetratricopeptide (TPR) repeat protein
MTRIMGRVGVCLGIVALPVWIALPGVLALPQEAVPEAGTTQEPGEPVPEEEPSPIVGTVADEQGAGIADAWLTIVAVERPDVKTPALLDDAGGFRVPQLPPGEGPWTIGDVGAHGYLLVTVSVERLDAEGLTIDDVEKLDYVPGVPMPEFRLPAEGAVKIDLVLGEKTDVAKRWAEARREAREAAQQEQEPGTAPISGDASAHWASGNEKFNARDFAGALADYSAALEAAPGEPRLLSAQASALFYLGRDVEARHAAEEALRAGAGDMRLLLALADRFNKAGDSENAEAILKALEEVAPDSADVQLQRARLSKREGDAAAAIAAYREATRLSPQNPKLWAEMAGYCRESGQEACAREAYATLVRLNPDYDKTAYYFLGALSEGQEAIEYYEKAARFVPEAYIKLCVAYREADETDKALAACRQYLEIKPDGPQADQVRDLLQALEP